MAKIPNKDRPVETISAEAARTWWKALMTNACGLIEDAAMLAQKESYGRATSLVVLSMEELAKARWLYEAAKYQWNKPLGLWRRPPEVAGLVEVPEQLRSTQVQHAVKLQTAERFASGLAGFWNEDRRREYYFPEDLETFEKSAKQRNLDKQAGFYVDRVRDAVPRSPLDIGPDGIAEMVQHAAQVLEMHLIEDHTRQQDTPYPSLIDSSQDLHTDILALAYPEEFATDYGQVEPADEHSPPPKAS